MTEFEVVSMWLSTKKVIQQENKYTRLNLQIIFFILQQKPQTRKTRKPTALKDRFLIFLSKRRSWRCSSLSDFSSSWRWRHSCCARRRVSSSCCSASAKASAEPQLLSIRTSRNVDVRSKAKTRPTSQINTLKCSEQLDYPWGFPWFFLFSMVSEEIIYDYMIYVDLCGPKMYP